jgi:transposase
MYVAAHHSIEQLQSLLKKEHQRRIAQRLQAVLWATPGKNAREIAALVAVQMRTVQNWIARYNGQSLEGLADHYPGGNRNKLTVEQHQQLAGYLDQQAQDLHARICQGRHLHDWIARQFGVVYSLSGLYGLLRRLDYRCLVPRPRHPKADSQAQEAFKKTSPSRSRLSRSSIRTRASKSGSRMRPASANKGR